MFLRRGVFVKVFFRGVVKVDVRSIVRGDLGFGGRGMGLLEDFFILVFFVIYGRVFVSVV